MITLNVQQVYFDAIVAGTKTIEGRLATQKYKGLQPGDEVCFSNNEGTQSVVKKVVALHLYPSFEEAFKIQNFKNATPNAKTLNDSLQIYERFYPAQEQKQNGVVFIEYA